VLFRSAAGALFALENNVERLAEDHQNAKILADAVQSTAGLRLTPEVVDTNIVIFEISSELRTAANYQTALATAGVLCLAVAPQKIRMVTHLDVSREQVLQAAKVLQSVTISAS